MAIGRTVWGPKVPTVKDTETSLSMYNVSRIFFNKCVYFTHHMAGYFLDRPCMLDTQKIVPQLMFIIFQIFSSPCFILNSFYWCIFKFIDIFLCMTSYTYDPILRIFYLRLLVFITKSSIGVFLFYFILFFKFLLLCIYSCMLFLPIPPPHPSQTHLPPPLHPPPWFCPCVLYSSSCNPLSPLSPPHSQLGSF